MRSRKHGRSTDVSPAALGARLARIGLSRHVERSEVCHARNFAVVSEAWSFESLYLWLRDTCDYSRTKILSRGLGDRRTHRVHSAAETFSEVARGRSLQILPLDRVLGPSDPLMALMRALQSHLGLAVEEIVMLFTPASRRAVKRHTDEIDVITLQILGTKHWDIWTDTELKDCGRMAPRFAIDLAPGSLLYVPAHAPHSVVAGSEESLSVALPLYRRSHRELLQELCALPAVARVLKKAVPGSGDVSVARRQLGEVASALAAVSDGVLSSAMAAVRRRPG